MKRSLIVLASVAMLALVLAACGGRSQPTPTSAPPTSTPVQQTQETQPTPQVAPTRAAGASVLAIPLPEVNPLEITGNIIVAGSSTVFPLTERMAERFRDEGYAGNITIDSIGSGAGFERFCKAGESDISNASRPIRQSEIDNCRAIGREPIEFRVGTDALAVVVNPGNDWIGAEGLTLEEVAKLFSSDVTTWNEVNPAWPNQPVKRFSPGTDSGTYDYFIEEVMDPAFDGNGGEALLSAANLQLSEDDNVLVQGVAGDLYAIAYFGFAYFEENRGRLADVAIDGVPPTVDSVNAATYALARPLFIYSDPGVMAAKPQVAAFINFYLSYVNEEVLDVGYFPAAAEALDTARQNWLDAMGSEQMAGPAAPVASGVQLPAVNPLQVSGNIIVAGSSTVFPLTERMAERFRDEGYAGNITIDSIGSGAGFERFCKAGESDISNASRSIRQSEIDNCRAIGREPIEFRVGTDALAVVVNPGNDWIGAEGLTLEEVAKLFSSDVTTWNEVNPAWPNQPVKRFSPGTDSGTYDYFIEEVMDPAFGGSGGEALLSAANLQLSEDDNVLVQGVAGDLYAIAYLGFAYFEENRGRLADVAIDGVPPNVDSVNAATYALARPLFIYSDPGVMAAKPQVAAFINFYLSYVDEEVLDVGYFPAAAEALDTARQNWLDAMAQ